MFLRLLENFRNAIISTVSRGRATFHPLQKGILLHISVNCTTYTSSVAKSGPVTMKIDSKHFKALFTEEVKTLLNIFQKYNYEIRLAGGPVRDLCLEIQPKDLDFATTATPDQMKEMFTTENIRMINAKGEKHGTITARINDKQNYEITTLRIDVTTDGRHAEVQFTKDWQLDANRRDLTINSMFLGMDGTLYDYFNGLEDLKKRKIVFVGNAAQRIEEDYLRILRYFRFYGRIAIEPDNHENETINCIKLSVSGLKRISGERIWSELSQILEGNYAGELLQKMLETEMNPYISFPTNPNISELKRVWKELSVNGQKYKSMTLLSSIFNDLEELMVFHERTKLSSFDRDLGIFIITNRNIDPCDKQLKPYQALVIHSKLKVHQCISYVEELLKYQGRFSYLESFRDWKVPKFPMDGHILRQNGVPGGKTLGAVLQKLKTIWTEEDFKLNSEDLISRLPEILESITTDHVNKK